MGCGKGAWWKSVNDPSTRDKARRYYYANRSKDLAGMKAAAAAARSIYAKTKKTTSGERKRKAAGLRGKRAKARGSTRAPF